MHRRSWRRPTRLDLSQLLAGLQKGVILKRVILRVGADWRTDEGEPRELLFTRQSAHRVIKTADWWIQADDQDRAERWGSDGSSA